MCRGLSLSFFFLSSPWNLHRKNVKQKNLFFSFNITRKKKREIMAMYLSNPSSNWILSLKVVLISTGVLSMAVALKLSVPVVADFVASEVPSFWSFVLSWLKPPYLYVLINGIIISIVASSKLHQKLDDPPAPSAAEDVKISGGGVVRTDYSVYSGVVLTGYGYDPGEVAKVSSATVESTVCAPATTVVEARVLEAGEEAVVVAPVRNSLQREDSSLEYFFPNENEKPPVSARFGHRKAVKASPEGGKALRVSKPKTQDTLESTWKTITEGRPMPLTRHLKKSDTWESHVRRGGVGMMQDNDQSTPPPAQMKKSETFADRNPPNPTPSPSPGSSGKLRKEPSLSQDELNRRVEAFIKKFNEEMRLQRQESLNQYQEMIRRGAQ